MKVTLILAEFASAQPNGLFTLVNGGIESILTSEKTAVVQGSLLVRLHLEAPENGKHTLKITLMDQDGQQKGPPINMGFESAPKSGAVALTFGVSVALPVGSYAFHAVMDGQLMASTPLEILAAPPPLPPRRASPMPPPTS